MQKSNVTRCVSPGMQVITLSRPSYSEVFITAAADARESAGTMLGRIASVIDDIGARIVSQELFGFSGDGGMQILPEAFGNVSWPVTWVEQDCAPAHGVGGTQLWAVAGIPVEPLELEGRIVGSLFEDDFVLLPPGRTGAARCLSVAG